MKVLVIGGGGREHALVAKIKKSSLVKKVFCAPGNAGIAELAKCLKIEAGDIDGLMEFAEKEKIDLTVVGPEAPLMAGIVDRFIGKGLKIFGPTKAAAQLEGSKSFCKRILNKHAIPTANFRVFESAAAAREHVEMHALPMVIKVDGLAAGKGVRVCKSRAEAEQAIKDFMEDRIFGDAGAKVIVEEFLEGEELSIMAITDGHTILVLEAAQDHKRAFDGDSGPNTGGMGAYSPVSIMSPGLFKRIEREILVQIVHAMKQEHAPFRGLLYAGLMLTKPAPRVLEFNVRFGDPETQAVLPRLKTDIVPILLATAEGTLDSIETLEWDERPSVTVVMASGGYPGAYETGMEITGLDDAVSKDVSVFHAGTRVEKKKVVTSGGRVLAVTALGKDFSAAREAAYKAVGKIKFQGAQFRTDIAMKAVRK